MVIAELIYVDLSETVVRILVAAACGAVLGWEREAHNKPAGLRTNMLVAIGAAAATMASVNMVHDSTSGNPPGVSADPIRIVSGIIGGLGFLGAGAIIQARGQVHGMTTAATIWVVGNVGVACGLAYYRIALTTTVLSFVTLFALGWFEHSRVAPESLRKEEESKARQAGEEAAEKSAAD